MCSWGPVPLCTAAHLRMSSHLMRTTLGPLRLGFVVIRGRVVQASEVPEWVWSALSSHQHPLSRLPQLGGERHI
jgi:hypothetical protein